MKHRITIPTNPANPVNYLACCGLFDLLARMDANALGWWTTSAPVSFILESGISEGDLLTTVLDTCCALDRWHFHPDRGEPTRIEVHFTTPTGQSFTVSLDWWLETAELDGAIRDKSAWKMYAGNQSVTQIVSERMVPACAAIRSNTANIARVAGLLEVSFELPGRFGFDPRGTVNALDRGYSPNDIGEPVPTFPFAELLATFGAQSFFPSRVARAGDLASTRGWTGAEEAEGEKGFAYTLWAEPLPVTLARLAAAHSFPTGSRTLFSRRDGRGQYSNLTLARTINPANNP
jgi:CRISPR-associated protein Csx14